LDSTNTPLTGVTALFDIVAPEKPQTTYTAVTDSNGIASGIITLPDCTGDRSRLHQSHGAGGYNWWISEFDIGEWRMRFPEAMPADEVGVGGENVTHVTLGHICRQTLH